MQKNDCLGLLRPSPRLKKYLWLMKCSLVIILFTSFQAIAFDATSQQRINLDVKGFTIPQIIKTIEWRYNYRFVYTDEVNASNTKLDLFARNATVDYVIQQMLTTTDFSYKKINNGLVVIIGKEAESATLPIKGRVVDDKGVPLSGVSVIEKGTVNGVSTGEDGQYELNVKDENAVLAVSMVGYQQKEVLIKDGNYAVIQLLPSNQSMEDVVVIGYGAQKKELLTGSVVNMKMDETRRITPTVSVGNLLAGQMTGVRVATPAGPPGTHPSVSIRVGTSFNAQNVLYVIDGKISGSGDFNNLSPNDIDNISVLKDAASAAVYGSRAAGGVIVVTTRRGIKGRKPQIDYSFSTGIDKRGKNAELTNAIEAGELFNRLNGSSSFWSWTQEEFNYFKNINNGWGYDQLAAAWQDPRTTVHNLGVSGGGDKIKYFVGGSYIKQDGFMKNLSYNKYNLRTNITADLAKNLSLFAGVTINNNLSYGPTNTAVGDVYALYRKLLLWQPDQPVWTEGGHPIDYGWIGNVGAEIRGDGGYNKSNYIKPSFILQLNYKISAIPGLSASAAFNKSYTNGRAKSFQKQYDMWVMKKTGNHIISTKDADLVALKRSSQIGKSFIEESYSWSNDYQLNFQLNYDRSFRGIHNVKGWLIYESARAQGGGIRAGRETFPVYLTDQWWAASGDRADSYAGGTTEYTTGRKSWVGQFFYDYKSKYIASFAYRYDGSMNFAPNKRWGFFPSGSVGWILSKENFFQSVKGIDMLKFRLSAGLIGNDAVGGWQWQQSYNPGNSAFFGTGALTNSGIEYGSIVNEDLTWEKTLNYNVGVDIKFLKHFDASVEYYNTRTYDILGQRIASVPPTFSRSLPSFNYGEIKAQGIEAAIGYRSKMGEFAFYADINGSYGAAKYVIQDQNTTYPWQKNAGNSTTRIATREVVGMIRTKEELDAFVSANPKYKFYGVVPELGQLIYKDISGPDGTPDGIVNEWDLTTVKKNNNPIIVGTNLGVEWKGFSVDASFNGSLRQSRFVNNLVAGNVEWNRMWRKWHTDSWTPENTNASLPKRYSINDGASFVTHRSSDFWLKNASFFRLKLLNIGYKIPPNITDKIGLSAIKIYFSGSNLFVISKFNKNYYDPEIADGFSFPIIKTYNFGLSVSF